MVWVRSYGAVVDLAIGDCYTVYDDFAGWLISDCGDDSERSGDLRAGSEFLMYDTDDV